MKLGLNVSVTSNVAMGTAKEAGPAYVRFPLWFGQQPLIARRLQDADAVGLTPILVFDRRAFTDWGWANDQPFASLALWKSRLPQDPAIIQVGNEPDGTGESSSKQTPKGFQHFIATARQVFPNSFLIAGGLTGINYNYLDGLKEAGADAVAVHPYGANPEDVSGIVTQVRQHTTLPLWVTEFGAEHGYYGDGSEHARAVWVSGMIVALWQAGVDVACYYCASDDQGDFGLQSDTGVPYEGWAAFTNAAPVVAPSLPPPPPPEVPITWVGSPNYWSGRTAVKAIVLHTMAGTLGGSDSWFNNRDSEVSAHFGVGLDGTIHQYVHLEDSAWANGVLEVGNTWPFGGSPNRLTVSIETEDLDNPGQPVTPEMLQSVQQLVTMVQQQYPGVTHLITHRVISPSSRPHCPGDRWVASGLMAQIATESSLILLT